MKKIQSLATRTVIVSAITLMGGHAAATTFCEENPNDGSCRTGQSPVTATGTGTGYGGHANAGAAADAIAGAMAANNTTAVQSLWSNMSQAQQTDVQNILNARFDNNQRNAFTGMVSGILRTGDANFSGLGSGNNTSVKLVTKNVNPSGNTVAGADGKTGEMKEGECGPLYDISGWKAYENYTVSYTLGGLFPVRDLVRTAVGSFPDGIPKFDRKARYRVEIHNLDASEQAEQGDDYVQGWTRYGHKLTKISSVVGTSGSSKATLHRGESGNTADVANAGAGGMPQYGYLVEECKVKDGYVKRKPDPKHEPETKPTPVPVPVPVQPKATAPAQHLMTIDEDVIVPGRKGGVIANVGLDWCKQNPGKCNEVKGTPGTRKRQTRTFDCNAPDLAPADAKRCDEAKKLAGQPPVVSSMPVPAPQ